MKLGWYVKVKFSSKGAYISGGVEFLFHIICKSGSSWIKGTHQNSFARSWKFPCHGDCSRRWRMEGSRVQGVCLTLWIRLNLFHVEMFVVIRENGDRNRNECFFLHFTHLQLLHKHLLWVLDDGDLFDHVHHPHEQLFLNFFFF